jgi:hypothetical protein
MPRDCATDLDLLVTGYCSAWNETDAGRRLHRLKSIWHEDATLHSAAGHVRGVREMDAHIGAFGAGRGGWRFVVTDVTAHGRHVHLTWKLVDPAGLERLAGHDVGECSERRRFDRIVSFCRQGATASPAGLQCARRMSDT